MAEGFSVTSPSTIKMPRYILSHSLLVRVVHTSYMYDLLCGTHSCDAGLVPIASMYPHLALNFNRAWKVWRLHILFNCAHLSWQKFEVWKISGAPETFQVRLKFFKLRLSVTVIRSFLDTRVTKISDPQKRFHRHFIERRCLYLCSNFNEACFQRSD